MSHTPNMYGSNLIGEIEAGTNNGAIKILIKFTIYKLIYVIHDTFDPSVQ